VIHGPIRCSLCDFICGPYVTERHTPDTLIHWLLNHLETEHRLLLDPAGFCGACDSDIVMKSGNHRLWIHHHWMHIYFDDAIESHVVALSMKQPHFLKFRSVRVASRSDGTTSLIYNG